MALWPDPRHRPPRDACYPGNLDTPFELREGDGLPRRGLGERLGKPPSWVYNCEPGNRRVDAAEVVARARGCGADPRKAFERLLGVLPDQVVSRRAKRGGRGRPYLKPLVEKVQKGEIDPAAIITHRLPLADAPQRCATFRDKKDGCVKVVLKP